MKVFHLYVPESFSLKRDRALEAATSVQTPREAESDAADLRKDGCSEDCYSGHHTRRGVPVVFKSEEDFK